MTVRKSPPTHGQIVQYWIAAERAGIPHPWGWFDWGEPGCFACGLYDPDAPAWDDAWKESDYRIRALWNAHHHYLDRCHVIPKCRGGSLDPSNFVLLCSECHRVSPEGDEPENLFRWMRECSGSVQLVHWTVFAQMLKEEVRDA